MQTSSPLSRPLFEKAGETSADCGACGAPAAYLVPGREVVRCRRCPARVAFDLGKEPLVDLWHAAARLTVNRSPSPLLSRRLAEVRDQWARRFVAG